MKQNKPIVVSEKAGKKCICVCGESKNTPYCDGSHKGTGMKPLLVDIEADRRVAWCACTQSGELPFCDGTHTTLE